MKRGSEAAARALEPSDEMQAAISERLGTPFMEGEMDFYGSDGEPNMAKMMQHMKRRLTAPE